jgi:murein L,D-transpeptidase YafK
MRSNVARCAGAALALLLAGLEGAPAAPRADAMPCPPVENVVAVFGRTHELYLCRAGAVEARMLVALGRGGMGKRRTGDGRTPIGTYAFGEPRASARYGTFIPIDYPTAEQRAAGYSGGEIGIHGPPRGWRDPVAASALDWTTGCIATGTDAEIERVARFVREARPTIVIR